MLILIYKKVEIVTDCCFQRFYAICKNNCYLFIKVPSIKIGNKMVKYKFKINNHRWFMWGRLLP